MEHERQTGREVILQVDRAVASGTHTDRQMDHKVKVGEQASTWNVQTGTPKA